MTSRAPCASTARKGVDVYFDNVGGEILDTVLDGARAQRAGDHLRRDLAVQRHRARSRSLQLPVAARQPREHDRLRRVRLRRSLRRGRAARWRGWLAAGKLISREEVAHGLETFPDTLLRLFSGENTGKLVLEL